MSDKGEKNPLALLRVLATEDIWSNCNWKGGNGRLPLENMKTLQGAIGTENSIIINRKLLNIIILVWY